MQPVCYITAEFFPPLGLSVHGIDAMKMGYVPDINVGKMATHIKAVSEKTGTPISYEIIQAKKDSSKVNREAAERQRDFVADLILLTASREYGLDDWLFGPEERHVIQRALVPVMLVNPREDLFSLCD